MTLKDWAAAFLCVLILLALATAITGLLYGAYYLIKFLIGG